jgi:Cellulase (glycosyl hydrolase family 5)
MPRQETLLVILVSFICASALGQSGRWPEQKASEWYEQQGVVAGSNYIPANAINELEMWQAETFDPGQIDKELGWAEGLGMNTMRVFLHDLLWKQDAAGFLQRIDNFLAIASKHHIRPIFVLFDSVWDPNPKLGLQHPPTPGVHNSGWVQSPGAKALSDPAQYQRLKNYVQGLISVFAKDSRVLAWDLWNEPDNNNQGAYGKVELKNKQEYVARLLPQVYEWARAAHPSQPLTSGVWGAEFSPENLPSIARTQLEQSDVTSFHNYGWPEEFEASVKALQKYHRPILCTEFMARGRGSTFDTILPIAKRLHVAAINWGLVAGKTQTYLPWDSWVRPYVTEEPAVWHHEVFYPDGRPYREREAELIREFTGKSSLTK